MSRPYTRIIVKLGTSVLTAGTRMLNRPAMVDLARQCCALQAAGCEVIICSSGAQAAGRERLDFPDVAPTLANKQMFAAVGQGYLMQLWRRFFEIYGVHVGQILLTRADIESRRRYLNARDAFQALMSQGVVPIVNENDAVATEEIRVGDNDNLSAMVATVAEADLLLLLTDLPGLYTADPRKAPDARLIPEVTQIDGAIRALAGSSVTGLGVGGMATKIQAAEMALLAGCDVVIAAGREPNVILRLAAGEAGIGTRFLAQRTAESRKRWILAGPKAAGEIAIDAGAEAALKARGRSLLPAGITGVTGLFQRGDLVRIVGPAGRRVARGIVRYSAADLARISGHHSADFESILGYTYGPVAIHRNDLILVEANGL